MIAPVYLLITFAHPHQFIWCQQFLFDSYFYLYLSHWTLNFYGCFQLNQLKIHLFSSQVLRMMVLSLAYAVYFLCKFALLLMYDPIRFIHFSYFSFANHFSYLFEANYHLKDITWICYQTQFLWHFICMYCSVLKHSNFLQDRPWQKLLLKLQYQQVSLLSLLSLLFHSWNYHFIRNC